MEPKTFLSTLSPHVQGLVEAALGSKLPSSVVCKPLQSSKSSHCNRKSIREAVGPSSRESTPHQRTRLTPAELFMLNHPESPGFVVKEGFLGRQKALAVRDALTELTEKERFQEAKVGAGPNSRIDPSMRGDKIYWIQSPSNVAASAETGLPALWHLRRQVEALVYGLKHVVPELNVRNVVSTQFSIFPGDGSRFVKHVDTYSNQDLEATSIDGLVRVITCVYYLNDHWLPEHGGQLRIHLTGAELSPACHWDISPKLDTLMIFRSLDVEHEVLPTYRERKAVTIWYYGMPPNPYRRRDCVTVPRPCSILPGTSSIDADQASIFVAIPSYRDSECKHTVENLLAQATFPERVSIGICLQSSGSDETLAYLKSAKFRNKVRIHWMDFQCAAGPCVARAHAQKLWHGEDYYLQIDSHMRFRPGWDCFCIKELQKCPLPKPILTTYPLGYTLPNEVSTESRPVLLCALCFDSYGMLRQTSKLLTRVSTEPLPSLFWAAGFAFSSARVIAEAPYDDRLRYLFFGEEVSMAARLWTSGWNFFAPSKSVVYHLWTRAYRPVFQELECEETTRDRTASLDYVKRLLQIELTVETPDDVLSVGTYGLGSERSLESFQTHTGIHFSTQEIEWRAEWGGLDPIHFDLNNTGKTLTPT